MSVMNERERVARERARTPHDKSMIGLLGPFVIGLIIAALVVAGATWILHEVFAPILDAFEQVEESR